MTLKFKAGLLNQDYVLSHKKELLPSAGRLVNINYPVGDIRVDNGYQSGGEVSIYYDSLLAKIISKGKDRNDALSKMQIALRDVAVEGIETNIDFLMDIYKKEALLREKSTQILLQRPMIMVMKVK